MWLALAVVGGGAAFLAYRVAVREAARLPSSAAALAPAPAASPPAPPEAVPAPAAPSATSAKSAHRGKMPHRVDPLTLTAKGARAEEPHRPTATAPGGLPHKAVATESRPLGDPKAGGRTDEPRAPPSAPTAPPGATPPAALAAPPEELPTEATPRTEEEMKAEAEASIDAESVRLVVKQHLPQVHACYSRAFKDSSPGGRVEIGFAVQPSGRADRVRTESNSTDSESLARCLESRVKEWQFPRPVGGEVELIYPFVFSSGS
jgi:hypothetical protein